MTRAQRQTLENQLSPDVEYIAECFRDVLSPEDVFSNETLRAWALQNGFTEKE